MQYAQSSTYQAIDPPPPPTTSTDTTEPQNTTEEEKSPAPADSRFIKEVLATHTADESDMERQAYMTWERAMRIMELELDPHLVLRAVERKKREEEERRMRGPELPPHLNPNATEKEKVKHHLLFTHTLLDDTKFRPSGLQYIPNYITPTEEVNFVSYIDKHGEWDESLRRRTQQYGFKYNYNEVQSQSDKVYFMDEIPPIFDSLIEKFIQDGIFSQGTAPNQLIVNEYEPGQGINPHADHEKLGDTVISISMLCPVNFTFINNGDSNAPYKQCFLLYAERCSAIVLKGTARYRWKHAIASVHKDMDPQGNVFQRLRRVSLTFRHVHVGKKQARTIKRQRELQKQKAAEAEEKEEEKKWKVLSEILAGPMDTVGAALGRLQASGAYTKAAEISLVIGEIAKTGFDVTTYNQQAVQEHLS
eukprot:TRINITY_DN20657_c0_g1_i1.p1 TRINITY_DN20657_c0_g1~~TRINITY_DN20657_c0_g1_i1.p1  ORF type:complete len:429 (-),score=39.02 TRINITY_DN20657_c0_g1_i1:614-1870(-)